MLYFILDRSLTNSDQLSEQVKSCLDSIINRHITMDNAVISLKMTAPNSFLEMTRTGWPGYGLDQDMYFSLATINGCNGLRALINYIMCFEGVYGIFLPPEVCQSARYSYENYPETAYDEAIQEISAQAKRILEEVEDRCITHVASIFKNLGRDDYALNAYLQERENSILP